MLQAIENATKHLCTDILGLDLEKGKSFGKNFYGSSIPLICNEKESHYYLFLKKETLNQFSKIMLMENKSLHEDGLNDLCKETINLIVGKAKSILSDKNSSCKYTLGTPEYLGKVSHPFPVSLDDYNIYKLKNRTFVIGIKHSK